MAGVGLELLNVAIQIGLTRSEPVDYVVLRHIAGHRPELVLGPMPVVALVADLSPGLLGHLFGRFRVLRQWQHGFPRGIRGLSLPGAEVPQDRLDLTLHIVVFARHIAPQLLLGTHRGLGALALVEPLVNLVATVTGGAHIAHRPVVAVLDALPGTTGHLADLVEEAHLSHRP
ncbi:hypothetical protein MZC64_36295 [Crossiella sp. S99.2]|nr:hypothetical protein [Crossiella sp. S99.2]MCK2254205.1 hypothetical protein [Crossiella sp. S99.1]